MVIADPLVLNEFYCLEELRMKILELVAGICLFSNIAFGNQIVADAQEIERSARDLTDASSDFVNGSASRSQIKQKFERLKGLVTEFGDRYSDADPLVAIATYECGTGGSYGYWIKVELVNSQGARASEVFATVNTEYCEKQLPHLRSVREINRLTLIGMCHFGNQTWWLQSVPLLPNGTIGERSYSRKPSYESCLADAQTLTGG